jgi:hypothetical protein
MYRISILIGFLLLFVTLPAFAQDTNTLQDCDLEEVTAFYEAVDPDSDASIQTLLAISSDSKTSAKFAAIEAIREIGESVSEFDYPECIEKAREWYLEGIDTMANSLESFVDGDFGTFASGYAEAMQRIGEYRGFMAAMGVDIAESETLDIYMR